MAWISSTLRPAFWVRCALLLGAYVAAGKLGLFLAYANPSASPVWPPSGIALAALLLLGKQYWPVIFGGALLVNITTTGDLGSSLMIAAGNTLEGVVCYAFLTRFTGGSATFERVNHVLIFIAAACVACAISASVGVFSLFLAGFAAARTLPGIWLTWWLGDVGGALTFTPLIVLWVRNPGVHLSVRRTAEVSMLFLFLAGLSLLFFRTNLLPDTVEYPLAFVCVLPILWAAIRFRTRATVTVTFLLSCIAVVGTMQGMGPFAVGDANTSLTLLQAFMIIHSIIGLALAAAMLERRLSENMLEEKVRQRTKELEQSQEKDRANLLRLRSTIRHLPTGALLMNEHGDIIELNEAYCRTFDIPLPATELLRISQDTLLEHFLSNLLHPDKHMEKVRQAIDQKEPIFGEEIHLKDGRIIVRDFLPIDEGGIHHGLLFLYRDVTRERRIDKAKSEFMSLASHQLRTPLTAIRWSLSHLQKRFPPTETQEKKILTEAVLAAIRMAETIETMLKISRMESERLPLEQSRCNLHEILRENASLFRNQYEAKNQSFVIDCPDEIDLQTDVKLLKEILRNLVQNAIKYTPEQGTITLRTRTESRRICIDIVDNGYGIPARQLQFVFQKFFRGDNIVERDTTGTGLGLYLVALLTKALRGTITLQSQEGMGSTFTLTLPTTEETSIQPGVVEKERVMVHA